jgi:YHS domain-containing protein
MRTSTEEERQPAMAHAHQRETHDEHAHAGVATVKDPVCGMDLRSGQAGGGSVAYAGTTYWFCNPGCREKFVADPARYVAPAPAVPAASPSAAPEGDEPPAAALQGQRAPDSACPVLHPPACREPLDAAPVWADPRAHRATRVAPQLIAGPAHGARAMQSGGRTRRVSLTGTVGVTKPRRPAVAPGPCVARMTSVDVSERANELTGGRVGSFNASTGG